MSLAASRAIAAVDARVLSGLKRASDNTGVDFSYLVAQASMESSLRPEAKAATSSASGLFQFIEQTWLSTFRAHGAKHGQAELAASIRVDGNGRCTVADPALRRRILDLRQDPALSAALGAELARDNASAIEATLGRDAGPTELYLAHFLGAGGASRFLSAMGRDPSRRADSLFPEAAQANRSVFYDGEGRPRSLAEVYDRFAGRMEREITRFTGPGGLDLARAADLAGIPVPGTRIGMSVGTCDGPPPFAPAGPGPRTAVEAGGGGGGGDATRGLSRIGASILSPTLVAALASLPPPGGEDERRPALVRGGGDDDLRS